MVEKRQKRIPDSKCNNTRDNTTKTSGFSTNGATWGWTWKEPFSSKSNGKPPTSSISHRGQVSCAELSETLLHRPGGSQLWHKSFIARLRFFLVRLKTMVTTVYVWEQKSKFQEKKEKIRETFSCVTLVTPALGSTLSVNCVSGSSPEQDQSPILAFSFLFTPTSSWSVDKSGYRS